MRLILLLLFIPLAFGQGLLGDRVQIGAVGGVAVNDPLRNAGGLHNDSKPYLVGPSVDIRLHGGFMIEVDALYRRLGNSGSFRFNGTQEPNGPIYDYSFRTRSNSWELPALAKYNFNRSGQFQPFLGTGYALRMSWSETESRNNNPTIPPVVTSDSRSRLGVGAVVAAGVSFQTGHFKISPQFRYTRWGGQDSVRLQNNQVDFMLGFHF